MPGTSDVQSVCHVVQLSPEGRGAIASILVSGPQATELVARCFNANSGCQLDKTRPGQMVFGHWQHTGEQLQEEVVVFRRQDQEIEIHCHGGHKATESICQTMQAVGCQLISWRQWLELTGETIQLQARAALADACTERTSRILLDQYNGALAAAVADILNELRCQNLDKSRQKISALLKRVELGRHLVCPWRVVLVGQTNVGKSSLVNALVGFPRSIVYDQPGTTRDALTAITAMAGWPLELIDTAGLRETNDPIEVAGIQRTRDTIETADLVLVVFDATSLWSDENKMFVESLGRSIVVINKIDLCDDDDTSRHRQWPLNAICTSANLGTGIDQLVVQITERLVGEPPVVGAAVPFHESHFAALREAADAVDSGDCSQAERVLSLLS